jgi:transmembrane sensor
MTAQGPVMPWEEDDDAASERAADFFARRRFGNWTDADKAELDAWLAESTLHRVAYLRLQGIADRTDHLAAVHTFKVVPESEKNAEQRGGAFRYRGLVLPLLLAASIAVIAAIAAPYAISLLQPPDRSDSTDIGGRTLLSFSDRTQVELNTNTAIRFRMTASERIVWLEKGEAWFHVFHDAAHPFTVIVGNHRITDLGTEFLVRRSAEDVEVALLNGRANLSAEGVQTATLTPGDDAIATPVSLSVTRKTPQELADELAWRQGILVFRNTKLAEVVAEFNRYNANKLVVADPFIANVKVTATVRTNDYESFLQLVEVVLKLRVDRDGNDILISRSNPEETKKAARIKHSL